MVNTETLINPEFDRTFESLKLIHNSRGYGWEIKLIPKQDMSDEDWLKRLKEINEQMSEDYRSLE